MKNTVFVVALTIISILLLSSILVMAAPRPDSGTISAISSSNIASSNATISWTTNEASDTQVEYGTTTNYENSTTVDTSMVTSHSQDLSDLSASTLYHYRVKSKYYIGGSDNVGYSVTSADQTFTTSGPDSGFVASWKFDENTGTIATDSSGNNNNGAVIGAIWTAGKIDNALSFNGNSDYVEVQKSTSLDSINNQITIEAWIKTPLTNRGTIVEKWQYDPTNERSYVLTVGKDGTVELQLSADGTYPSQGGVLSSSNKVPANTWTHIAVTSDGTTMRAYINGNPDPNTAASPAGGIYVSNANLHLGAWQYSSTDKDAYSSGSLDQVRIYNHALSGEEILAEYNAGSSGIPSIAPSDPTPPAAPSDPTPLTISSISAKFITSSGTTILWATNEASDTQVEYGTTTSYEYSSILDTNFDTLHSQALSGLTASTLYHYRVKSKDATGNLVTSPDQTFTTSDTTPIPPSDPTPPTAPSDPTTGPDSGVIASWKFDENTGTTATDSSGNNNNGAVIGATWTQGIYGNALSFNGNSNYVEVQKSTSLDSINNQITIEAWINAPLTTRGTIVEKWQYDPTNERSYVLTVETDGTVELQLSADGTYPSSGGVLYSSNKVPANTWTHIAVTSDGTTMRTYINGNPDSNTAASQAGGIYVSNANLHLGAWQYSSTDETAYFPGSLDQVKIYNHALSGEEILAEYNAGSSGIPPIAPSDPTPPTPDYNSGGRNPTGNPVGGGAGYSNMIDPADATYTVSTKSQLLSALSSARSGDIVYVTDSASIDLTSESNIAIQSGVILASGRGRAGSQGALLYNRGTGEYNLFITGGDGVRVTGLRIDGKQYTESAAGKTTGIYSKYNIEVDNNELFGFSYGAVTIKHYIAGSYSNVHHNYIHNNIRDGLGYGVAVNRPLASNTNVMIEANKFDYNRHSIAGTGNPDMSYTARYNIQLGHGSNHAFDVHGDGADPSHFGGNAGKTILIYGNTFYKVLNSAGGRKSAIVVRGVPVDKVEVYDNDFYYTEPQALTQFDFDGKELADYKYTKMYVHDNCFSCTTLTGGT